MQSVAGRLPIAFMLAAALAAPARLGAQDTSSPKPAPKYRARILGVFDEQSGEPVENVRVLDVLDGNSVLTTKTGTASLAFLPDGGSLVRIERNGYATQTLMVEISPADTSLLTVMMSAAATELPEVVTVGAATKYISPNLRGFEDRMKYENGYYIDEPTLRKNESRMLSNLLETKPGVQISRGMANSAYLWRSPRCTNGGPPAVYLDGVPLSPTPTRDPAQAAASGGNTRTVFGLPSVESPGDPDLLPFNLSEINISDLAGVEWYPDSEIIPAEFAHTSGRCGALLLWTREK